MCASFKRKYIPFTFSFLTPKFNGIPFIINISQNQKHVCVKFIAIHNLLMCTFRYIICVSSFFHTFFLVHAEKWLFIILSLSINRNCKHMRFGRNRFGEHYNCRNAHVMPISCRIANRNHKLASLAEMQSDREAEKKIKKGIRNVMSAKLLPITGLFHTLCILFTRKKML